MGKKKIISILGDASHDHDLLWNGLNVIIGKNVDEFELVDIQASELDRALDNNPEIIIISKMNPFTSPDGKTGNWLAGALEEKLIEYIEAGGSLIVWHSGLYGHPADGRFIRMIGGRFTHRPPDFLNVKYSTVANTPMTDDAKEIEILDEHFLMACDMEKANVFMNSVSSGGDTPAGWYRMFENGKICCISAPHPTKDIKSSLLNEIFYNCLRWCSVKEK